jgi:LAO/AO transport system kinase
MRPKFEGWSADVRLVSSTEGRGIAEVWADVEKFHTTLAASGAWDRQRRDQRAAWLHTELREGLLAALTQDPAVNAELIKLEAAVAKGTLAPTTAAKAILAQWRAKT